MKTIERYMQAREMPPPVDDDILEVLTAPQRDTLQACTEILLNHRAVLLDEDTGTGKTFIGAALAAWYARLKHAATIVIAPAHVLPHWHTVLERFGVQAGLYSYQMASLGRVETIEIPDSLWLLDEAHWLKNPATLRYRFLRVRTAKHRVCLMTATPICLSWADLKSLMGLCGMVDIPEDHAWLRSFANAIRPRAFVRALTHDAAVHPGHRTIPYHLSSRPGGIRGVIERIQSIPWLVQTTHGAENMALLVNLLMHRMLSHRESCLQSLKKMARYYRVCANRPGGCLMTRRQFYRMMGIEGRQLCLPLDIRPQQLPENAYDLREIQAQIAEVVRELDDICRTDLDEKMQLLQDLLTHRDEPMQTVIFTQYTDTAQKIEKSLHALGRVALLASGISRLNGYDINPELLTAMFSPSGVLPDWWASTGQPTARILICTDAYASGQNFQKAARLIHFDLPWNPTLIKQRDGRLIRRGQTNRRVEIVTFRAADDMPEIEAYQSQLRTRIQAREELQRNWRTSSETIESDELILCNALGMPHYWAKHRNRWYPISPSDIPKFKTARVTTCPALSAFACNIAAIRKRFAPQWQTMKHNRINPHEFSTFVNRVYMSAIFPQLQAAEDESPSAMSPASLPLAQISCLHLKLCTTYPQDKASLWETLSPKVCQE